MVKKIISKEQVKKQIFKISTNLLSRIIVQGKKKTRDMEIIIIYYKRDSCFKRKYKKMIAKETSLKKVLTNTQINAITSKIRKIYSVELTK